MKRGRVEMDKVNYSEVARVLGVDTAFVSRMYRGLRSPSVETLRKLARYHNVSMDVMERVLRGVRRRREEEKVERMEQAVRDEVGKEMGVRVGVVKVKVGEGKEAW